MRAALLLACLAACSARPRPAPTPPPARVVSAAPVEPEPRRIVFPPPPDVPIPHIAPASPDVEWTSAPTELEPHYDIAAAYATADWRQACFERGQPRTGDPELLLRYVLAWCALGTRGATATRDELLLIASTGSGRLADAVRSDLVALVAADLDADVAIRWLAAQRLDRLDELAVAYHGLGRDREAQLVLRFLTERPEPASTALRCRRMQRVLALGSEPDPGELLALHHDPSCEHTLQAIACPPAAGQWTDTPADCDAACAIAAIDEDHRRCSPSMLFASLQLQVARASVRVHWPATEQRFAGWITFARYLAASGIEAQRFKRAAFDNAVRASRCSPDELEILADNGRHETVESCRRAQP